MPPHRLKTSSDKKKITLDPIFYLIDKEANTPVGSTQSTPQIADSSSGSLAEPPYRVHQGGAKKSTTVCTPTLTIRNFQAEKKMVVEEQQVEEVAKNASFTMNQLQVRWAAFTQLVEKEPMLHSTLLKNPPENLEGSRFSITVDTPSQQGQLNDWKPKVLAFLREKLDNTTINFEVQLRDISEAPRYRTPLELFNVMLERHPDLVQFKDLFGLEMA